MGITGGLTCSPLQAVQQVALGASHAGSYTSVCAELPFFTQNTDTFTTISKTTVLRMMYNKDLEQSDETGEGMRAKG